MSTLCTHSVVNPLWAANTNSVIRQYVSNELLPVCVLSYLNNKTVIFKTVQQHNLKPSHQNLHEADRCFCYTHFLGNRKYCWSENLILCVMVTHLSNTAHIKLRERLFWRSCSLSNTKHTKQDSNLSVVCLFSYILTLILWTATHLQFGWNINFLHVLTLS